MWQRVGPMAIRIPNLAASHCKGMIVCGDVQTDDSRLLRWMKKQDNLSVRYRTREGTCYVLAVFGSGDDGKTFHLDMSVRDFFKGKSPRATDKISDLQEVVNHLEGQTI